MAARAPIAGLEPLEAPGPPDALPCRPCADRSRKNIPTAPCTRREQSGPCHRRRNAPEENLWPARRSQGKLSAPVQRIAEPGARALSAAQDRSPDGGKQRRKEDCLQDYGSGIRWTIHKRRNPYFLQRKHRMQKESFSKPSKPNLKGMDPLASRPFRK